MTPNPTANASTRVGGHAADADASSRSSACATRSPTRGRRRAGQPSWNYALLDIRYIIDQMEEAVSATATATGPQMPALLPHETPVRYDDRVFGDFPRSIVIVFRDGRRIT